MPILYQDRRCNTRIHCGFGLQGIREISMFNLFVLFKKKSLPDAMNDPAGMGRLIFFPDKSGRQELMDGGEE